MQPGDRAQVKYDTEVYTVTDEVIGSIRAGTEVFISMGPNNGKFAIEAEDGQIGWVDIKALEKLE